MCQPAAAARWAAPFPCFAVAFHIFSAACREVSPLGPWRSWCRRGRRRRRVTLPFFYCAPFLPVPPTIPVKNWFFLQGRGSSGPVPFSSSRFWFFFGMWFREGLPPQRHPAGRSRCPPMPVSEDSGERAQRGVLKVQNRVTQR